MSYLKIYIVCALFFTGCSMQTNNIYQEQKQPIKSRIKKIEIKTSAPKPIPFDKMNIVLTPIIPKPIENKSFYIPQVRKEKIATKIEVQKIKKLTSAAKTISKESDIPDKITEKIRLKQGSYYIEKTIIIEKTGSLIIEAGTEIEMDSAAIICYGELIAEGTKSKPISFSGDQWDNITASGKNASILLKYCTVNGGFGMGIVQKGAEYSLTPQKLEITYGGSILVHNQATAKIYNCKFTEAYGKNMIAILNAKNVELHSCQIANHSKKGIYSFNSKITLLNNSFNNHSIAAIDLNGISSVVIKKNSFTNCKQAITKEKSIIEDIKNNTFKNCTKKIITK